MMHADITTAPVNALIRRLAVPVGIGFFFNTMYNVVDTWFAGKISTEAVAAVSISFPLFFIIIAIGSGISTGATALIGHAIGGGDHESAARYAHQSLSFALINSIILATAGIISCRTVFSMMGASGEYLNLADSYMSIIFAGTPFFILNQTHNGILNASGDTESFRNFLLAAFFLNLIYDPWFIYGGFGIPPLGLKGIATATIVIQLAGTLYLHSKARKTGLLAGKKSDSYSPDFKTYKELFKLGFPSSLTMLTVSIGIFLITWYVGKFGREAVAAYGIATRIEQMVLLPVMGLNIAVLTLVAQNSGAKLFARVKESVEKCIKSGVFLMIFGTLILLLTSKELVGVFSNDKEVIRIGADYLFMASFLCHAYVILYICSFALQGMKEPRFPLAIGFYRQLFAQLPVFWLFVTAFGWGLKGVWWGIFAVNWSAALISYLYVKKQLLHITEL